MLALVPSLTSGWDVGRYSQNLDHEASSGGIVWVGQYLAGGWSSVNSPAGDGIDASSRFHSAYFKGQAEAMWPMWSQIPVQEGNVFRKKAIILAASNKNNETFS